MSKNKTKSILSINILSLATILFITLKLTNVINWSWWWVLSPIWLPIVSVIIVYTFIILAGVTWLYSVRKSSRGIKQEEQVGGTSGGTSRKNKQEDQVGETSREIKITPVGGSNRKTKTRRNKNQNTKPNNNKI